MSIELLKRRIIELPVFDTHSHVNAPERSMGARNFGELGHYFWLSQQLQGVGWREPEAIDQAAANAYYDAFVKTENTAMNWCLRRILLDVYGVVVRSPKDILVADALIQEQAQCADHIQAVCAKGNIQKIVQNLESQALYPEMPELGILVADTLNATISSVVEAPSQDTVDAAVSSLTRQLDALSEKGQKGVRIDYNLFELIAEAPWRKALLDAIFGRLHQHKMFVQIFLGMERRSTGSYPQYDAMRITQMDEYFLRHPNCRFELVCAAEGNCLDVVQAAVKCPNVYPGGLWWYTFRPSMFMQTMQQRLEALPAMKCPLLVSDATSVEWCYGKSMLVKTLAAEFLSQKVADAWITEECALRTASAWLYDAPASYYL